jgi:two-component system C4-dicarboxylate transport response regulator DctD
MKPMNDVPTILLVDDEPFNLDVLAQQLESTGYEIASTTTGQDALQKISADFRGIVITDIRMPAMSGLELLQHALRADPELPVILISAYGDIPMAVQAMRDGAYDFIERPIDDPSRLRDMVGRAMKMRLLVLENRALRADIAAKSGMEARILGSSRSITALRDTIANLADTTANVLIQGETGTGKELVARCLHDFSHRSNQPFVAVNCGAMPESILESELFGHEAGAFTGATKRRIGKFEHAHGGTLFLDEVESIPLNMQVKLLRVLEEREIERLGSNEVVPVDFRIVAATQGDLSEVSQKGEFRQDLFFRLNVAEIAIPPLRDRREDIPMLFDFFSGQLAARHERIAPTLSRDEIHTLMTHNWPGNVRELRNVVERYVLGLTGVARPISTLIQPPVRQPLTLGEQVDDLERLIIKQNLAEHKGNIQATVDALGTPRRTLNQKMRKYGLDRKDYR